MSIKDLFGKKSNKVLTKKDLNDLVEDVESQDFISSEVSLRTKFIPKIDFSKPENFAKYGLAEKYYSDSYYYITSEYPYDGSSKEKNEWEYSASPIDLWIFENNYPRTTGYVTLNKSYTISTNQTDAGGKKYARTLSSATQNITFFGGPHADPSVTSTDLDKQFPEQGGNANIYDPTYNREVNLDLNGVAGNTIEFYCKVDSTNDFTANSQTACLLDIWNGEAIDSASYSRFLLEYDHERFLLTYRSGALGAGDVEREPIAVTGNGITTAWKHFAVSAIDSGSDCEIRIYIDGEPVGSTITVANAAVGQANQLNLKGSIGTYLVAPNSTLAVAPASLVAGDGAYPGLYVDELRFWKTKRTSKDIGRHWFTQVNGGTNTDTSNTDLGLYYKFNEGIFNSLAIDSNDEVVLDCSGRLSNGTISNYTITVRSTGSAIDEHTTTTHTNTEFKDPIIHSTNPSVVSARQTLVTAGQNYDYTNNNSLYRSLPGWILQDDEVEVGGEKTTLKNLTQVMASYFDNLYYQITEISKLKDVDYSNTKQGEQPYFFAKKILESTGLISPDLFVSANVLEEFASRGEDKKFSNKLSVLKNLIYQNVYNNIVHIYKSKGTEKSFRNLLRCFGVDEDLIRINLYADNADYQFVDNVRHTTVKKRQVDFSYEDAHSANIYQYQDPSDTTNTRSFISSDATKFDYIPTTMEAEVMFPKDLGEEHPSDVPYRTFLSSSLFGIHESNPSTALVDQANVAWHGTDDGNFQVYAVRESAYSKNAKFVLHSTGYGTFTLTSDVCKNVYDGEKWNFAVRIIPRDRNHEITDRADSTFTHYTLEFYGVNTTQNSVDQEFTLTQSIALADAQPGIRAAKRPYCGAHRTDYTGGVLTQSDVKVNSIRYWLDYIDDTTVKSHAYDIKNVGRRSPDSPSNFGATSLVDGSADRVQVPEIETLVLNWDFSNVATSDGSGQFVVSDASSGSASDGTYDWFSTAAHYRHTARGDFFPLSSTTVARPEYLSTAKPALPETISSSDMIKILSRDDETFTRDTRPITYFFAAEKSMYQTVSEEMMNMFSGVARFNELVGAPVNRYRQSYKNLEHLREIFFEREINDITTLERYVNFYKWLDSSISGMIEQLFPASANFSEGLNTVIESHILERSKYWNKMPTVEFKDPQIQGSIRGIRELLYDWEHGHAPVSVPADHDESCLWLNERYERTDTTYRLGPALPVPEADREAIRKSVTRDVKGNSTPFYDPGTAAYIESEKRFYDSVTSTTYEGNAYAVRRLSKPYNFAAEKTTHIRGGVNYSESKKDILNKFRSSTKITAGAQGVEIEGSKKSDPSCLDATVSSTPKFKNATSVSVTDSTGGAYDSNLKGEKLLPFNYHFSTPNASTFGAVPDSLSRTNIHSDSYGDLNETPMQGPFTDQWVGGNQHRHVTLTTTQKDLKRPELYIEDTNVLRHPHDKSTANYAARYTRDGLAKRPLNIANIKTTAGATEDTESNELPHGNYTHHYEVVQAHGRNLQNRWFVKNEGISAFDSINPSSFVTDTTGTGVVTFPLVDFVLPDRDKDKLGNSFGSSDHVFVERFSAPGSPAGMSRGSLDAESEQYSPYNTVNYRNLLGRQHLNHWHSDHADAFGYRDTFIHSSSAGSAADGSSTENVASWHKNNRNAITRMFLIDPDESDANHALKYGSENSFDNFHVGHQVPRSDWQYGWINSATGPAAVPTDTSTVHDRISGYASDYTNISINAASAIPASSTITYPDATTATISYVGLNDLLEDPIDLATGKQGYDCNLCGTECHTGSFYLTTNTASDRNELNILLLTRNGPYGYSSWKQIRTGEAKLAKAQRKNNIISVQDEPQVREVTSSSGVTFTYRDNRADTFKNYYEPASIWNKPMQTLLFNKASRKSVALKHTYSNNLEIFSNPNLTNRLGIVKCEKQMYDRLLELYKEQDGAETEVGFNRLRYREIIYPKHRHTSLKYTRQRNNYSESETKIRNNPTGFFGFVYNQNKLHIRTFWKDSSEDRKRGLSAYNALGYSYSPSQYGVYKQKDSVWALDDYMEYVSGSMTLHILGDLGHAGTARYNDWISAYSRVTTREVSTTTFETPEFWPTSPIPGRGFPTYSKTFSGGTSYDTAYEGREILESPCGTNEHQADEPIRIGTTGVSGYGASLFFDPELTRKVGTSDELLIASSGVLPDSTIGESTPPRPTGFITEESASIDAGVDAGVYKALTNLAAEEPRPALQFLYNPYNRELNEKGWSWRTGEISSNKPWYDSYEEYSEDIRLMGQNYGTLSEFRVSQHMGFYVQNGSSNFRSDNYNFLTLDGSNKRTKVSGDAVETTSKLYSRMGMGINPGTKYPDYADVIAATPTTEDPYQFKLIKNNAYYYIGVPGEGYTRYREQNQFYASGTLTIDNSVNSNVIYSRTTIDNINSYANENTGATISGLPDSNRAPSSDWVPILPYNGCRSAALSFNTTCDSDDYIFCPITQWGSSNVIDISQTTDNQGGALTLSFWVKPSKNAMENCEYVGSTCMVNKPHREGSTDLLENPTEEIGIWLKCPTVTTGLFEPTPHKGVGGLTFYMNPKVSNPLTPATASASANIFHFMSQVEASSAFVPTVLPTDRYSHIVLQIIPSTVYSTGPVTSPGKVMMWLNGERLYAAHPTSLSSGVNSAWSAVEPGSSYGGTTYGSGFTSDFAKMKVLVAGKNMVGLKREDKFYGEMDELSLFRGVLTTTSVANLYNSGAQTNVMEEFYNYRLSSVYLSQADINSHYGSTSPFLNITGIAIPHVDYSIPAPTAAISPQLPELSIWWRMGVSFSETRSSVTRKYSDDFFDRHSHTDTPQHLFDIMNDHETKRKRIRITANAVKKLIPYNGFYPSQRTVQLGHLFKEDYFKTISKGLEDEDAFWDSQRLQSLLQGFFAPGILYNSIKSGIAVDWPAFTNETGNEPPNFGAKKTSASDGYYEAVAPSWYDDRSNPYSSKTIYPSGYKGSTEYFTEQPKFSSRGIPKNDAGFVILDEPNLRIPFEGLLAPESAVPREDSRSTSILDQSKLYTNITLDIGSYDCEGNDITLFTPVPGVDPITIKIRRKDTFNSFTYMSDEDEIRAGFSTEPYTDYFETSKAISKDITAGVCEKINQKYLESKSGWVAVPADLTTLRGVPTAGRLVPGEDLSGLWRTDTIYGQFVLLSRDHGIEELDSIKIPKTSSPNERIRLYYIGRTETPYEGLADIPALSKSLLRILNPSKELIEESENAKITIEQTFADRADTSSSYFVDGTGTRRLYSSLTNLGIFPLNENNAIDRQVNTSGINVKKTIYTSGGVPFSTVFPGSKPYEIFLMAPEYYTGSQLDVLQTKRYPSFEMKGNPKTDLYKMAMHNFLAEVPSFFLQNSTLTSFASAPEDQFKEMLKGHTYYMDVGLFKTEDFHMAISPNNKMLKPSGDTTNGRYFGPAFRYKDADKYNSAGELVADPSQAPYTPAYHYGKATARLSFTAPDTRKYSLNEILGSLKVETFNEEAKKYFETVCRQQAALSTSGDTETVNSNPLESPAYNAMMTLTSSVNVQGKSKVKTMVWASTGERDFKATSAEDPASSDKDAWVISTKFESPVLNFLNEENVEKIKKMEDDVIDPEGIGMWSGYGSMPKAGQGVFLTIEETFPEAGTAELTGSLIDICGFNTRSKQVGRVAESKEISEAIVMIPFVDKKIPGRTITVDNREIFLVDKGIYQSQRRNISLGNPAVPRGSVVDFRSDSDIEKTSISNMIEMMDKYYVPPKYNFAEYEDLSPFVMYFVEFTHTLNQKDLVDIWQGVMPGISKTAEKDVQSIVHDISPVEFFGGQDIPDDVRWMTFRVKPRGNTDYNDFYKKSLGDSRFTFDFNIGEEKPLYSYNWPYDFYSLVELSQIQVGTDIYNTDSFDAAMNPVYGELPSVTATRGEVDPGAGIFDPTEEDE